MYFEELILLETNMIMYFEVYTEWTQFFCLLEINMIMIMSGNAWGLKYPVIHQLR